MSNIRRGYIYIASIASLEAATWAVITLLRNLLAPGIHTSLESTALQIATIIVALPLYLVHWLWAQRLAGRDREERGAPLRRLYLYGAMASFLIPFITNAMDLVDGLLRLAFDLHLDSYRYIGLSQADVILHNLVVMLVMAVVWAYHWRVTTADARLIPEEGRAATIRRWYVYGFSAIGLMMTTLAVIYLSRWLMFQLGGAPVVGRQVELTRELARLAVGLPLWLIFWGWAQRRFTTPDEEERNSVLRKFYLYLAVFLSVLATVTTLTILLANGLGRLLNIAEFQSSGGDIREALGVLIGAGMVWAYHASVLRRDAALAGEPATAAWVRQLYYYLVAAIGLGALLGGLAGVLSFLLRLLAGVSFVGGVPAEVAWFLALIIIGLPVWILPWRRVQTAATAPGAAGDLESRSLVRKIYLYFYLLVATLAMLGSGVYVVYRLISLLLGVSQPGNLLADLGQAIGYSLLAVGIWLYHGACLRADARRIKGVQVERMAALHVAILESGDKALSQDLIERLQHELPGLNLQALDAEAAETPAALAQADLIIGPWSVLAITGAAAQAMATSPAPKVLLYTHQSGWYLAGVGKPKAQESLRQAVRTVRQLVGSGEIKARQSEAI